MVRTKGAGWQGAPQAAGHRAPSLMLAPKPWGALPDEGLRARGGGGGVREAPGCKLEVKGLRPPPGAW